MPNFALEVKCACVCTYLQTPMSVRRVRQTALMDAKTPEDRLCVCATLPMNWVLMGNSAIVSIPLSLE